MAPPPASLTQAGLGSTSSNSTNHTTAGPLFKPRVEESRTSRLDEQQNLMKLKHVNSLMANYNGNPAGLYAESLQAQHNMRVPNPAAPGTQFNNQYGLLNGGLPGFSFPTAPGSLNSAWAAIQAQLAGAAQVENNKDLLAAAQAGLVAQAAAQQKNQHGLMGHGSPTAPGQPSYPSNLPVTSFGPISGATKSPMMGDMFNGIIDQPTLKMNLEKNMMHSILLKGQFNSPSRRSPHEKSMIEWEEEFSNPDTMSPSPTQLIGWSSFLMNKPQFFNTHFIVVDQFFFSRFVLYNLHSSNNKNFASKTTDSVKKQS